MKEQVIKKSFKFVLSKKLILVPFSGNLTENKKESIAKVIHSAFLNILNSKASYEDVFNVAFGKSIYSGNVEKNISVEENEFSTSLRGEGWTSSNCPKNDILILEEVK